MKKYFNTKTVIVAIVGAIVGVAVWLWNAMKSD